MLFHDTVPTDLLTVIPLSSTFGIRAGVFLVCRFGLGKRKEKKHPISNQENIKTLTLGSGPTVTLILILLG
jgi:hypothetical protein